MKALLIFAMMFAGLVVASSARAQAVPRTLRLEVVRAVGADACPDADAFRDAVDVAGGFDPFRADAKARLVVTILSSTTISRGRWQLVDEAGAVVRERSASVVGTCKQLVSELALSFVVAYETPAAQGDPPPAPAPCPPPVCDEACRARARDEVRDEVRREMQAEYGRKMDGVSAAVLAGGLMSAGLTANVGPGFFIGGEVHGEMFHGILEARVLFPSYVETQPGKTHFDITSATIALAPCARWNVLMGCAVFDVGMLVAGSVATNPSAGPPIVATLGIGPRLAVRVPFAERFALRAFADLRFAPIPSTFGEQDTGNTWQSGIVSGLFGLGASFE